MTFPVYLPVGGWRIHPHPVLEAAGYFVGGRIYFVAARRSPSRLSFETRTWILIGCAFGAFVGSKFLSWAEAPRHFRSLPNRFVALLGGKTIVGGLLGGWTGVEAAKKACGVRASTGDDFVWPLAAGISIGRIGCFLTGLDDRTYGQATGLPWGVDFGDGIRRHPTQLYECLVVLLMAAVLSLPGTQRWPPGARFRAFLAAYLFFRLVVEFIKPREILFSGLSAIQWASVAGCLFATVQFGSLRPWTAPTSSPTSP